MDDLIESLIKVLKEHYSKNQVRSKKITAQLKELDLLIAKNLDEESEPEHYLFFNELTPEAQAEFLEQTEQEYEEIDESRPIAKLTLLQKRN